MAEFVETGYFTNINGENSKTSPLVQKSYKETSGTKKPAYHFYLSLEMKKVREHDQNTPYRDQVKNCSEKWKLLTDEEKAPFLEMEQQHGGDVRVKKPQKYYSQIGGTNIIVTPKHYNKGEYGCSLCGKYYTSTSNFNFHVKKFHEGVSYSDCKIEK